MPRSIWSITAFASTCCGCGSVGAGAGGTAESASPAIGIANGAAGCAVRLDAIGGATVVTSGTGDVSP